MISEGEIEMLNRAWRMRIKIKKGEKRERERLLIDAKFREG
jgi:hypothetical protein